MGLSSHDWQLLCLSRGSPCQLQCPCHWGCCWFSFSSYCFCCFCLLLSSLLCGHNLWSWVVFTTTLSYCNMSSGSAGFSHRVSPFPPACVKHFPPMPFPCFSQVAKPSSSESLSCQAAAKAFFSLLSLQIDFFASRGLIKTFCCLPWAFLLLPLPTLKCISPFCPKSLQQPPGIQAELLNGSQRQWVSLCCLPAWHAGSNIHLL